VPVLAPQIAAANIEWLFGGAWSLPPAGCFLSLHSGDFPTAENQINGWAGGDRVMLQRSDFGAIKMAEDDGSDGAALTNARAIQFGVHVNSQVPLSFALWDSAIDGNQLFWGCLEGEVLEAGNPPIFLVGEFIISVL